MRLFSKIDGNVDRFDRPMVFGGPFDRPWYHVFPILGRGPSADDFVEEVPFDPVHRSDFVNGAVLTRMLVTLVPRQWNIVLEKLTTTDKQTLDTFQRDAVHFGSSVFKWQDTSQLVDGVYIIYRVRFLAPIVFTVTRDRATFTPNKWKAEFTLFGN